MAFGFPLDGEFEVGFALRPAPDRSPTEEPPAEGLKLAMLELSQAALQEHTQIVGDDGQVVDGLGGREGVAGEALDAKLVAQLPAP